MRKIEMVREGIKGLENERPETSLSSERTVTVERCLKDEQINIIAMTEGVEIDGEIVHQCILCKNVKKVKKDRWYLLVPKTTPRSEFTPSRDGKIFQRKINAKYGEHLEKFKYRYIAEVIETYQGKNIARETWKKLGEENLFLLWESKSSVSHTQRYSSDLMLFRVYEIEEEMGEHIQGRGERVAWLRPMQVKIIKPIVSEEEFMLIKQKSEEILRK